MRAWWRARPACPSAGAGTNKPRESTPTRSPAAGSSPFLTDGAVRRGPIRCCLVTTVPVSLEQLRPALPDSIAAEQLAVLVAVPTLARRPLGSGLVMQARQ